MKNPPQWRQTPDGIDTGRHAEWWHREGDRIRCDLCYRKCLLGEGEVGTCGFRGVETGRMRLRSHGVISCAVRQVRGWQVDPFLTYKPGQTSVFFGGIQCTSACTFCMSAQIVHNPAVVTWWRPPTEAAAAGPLWYASKALLHPRDAIREVEHHGAASITFGINEPTLSYEWTIDVATLAKKKKLDVVMETNGFTEPAAIRQLARYVDAVDVGVKGSADPDFYAKHMRSPGAVPSVLRSLELWRERGVHVIVGDLLAAPHMQDDATFREAARRFYDHIAERLGPLTDVLVTPIMQPANVHRKGYSRAELLVREPGEKEAYLERLAMALDLARGAGLPYAHTKKEVRQTLACHNCSAPLLRLAERCGEGRMASGSTRDCAMPEVFCPWWSVETHVTNGRCDSCGTAVPIVAMTPAEAACEAEKVRASAQRAGLAALADLDEAGS